jgi:hypothetical protein
LGGTDDLGERLVTSLVTSGLGGSRVAKVGCGRPDGARSGQRVPRLATGDLIFTTSVAFIGINHFYESDFVSCDKI